MPKATTSTVTRGRPLVVAIDGPSGSGKSSTARGVARRLGLAFLDTGAMYRAATWLATQRGVDLTDTAAVAELVRDAEMDLVLEPDAFTIAIDGTDVTTAIRAPEVSAVVSAVATNLDVRADLVARQRELIATTPGGIVAEGRDITTVVAPDADVRVLLVADPQARIARRHAELSDRPNVGKSTLVNRILGRRQAVVQDVPGVTRDRVSYDAEWSGRDFVLVDTGGWAPDAKGMAAQIAEQAELGLAAADAVGLVVDATVGIQDVDEAVVRVLRRSRKPVVLAANKVDDQRGEAEATSMWNLGLGEPYAVSALHGRGSGDLLDAIVAALPAGPIGDEPEEEGPRRVAIVGKPNVGKSSLLNKLARQQRVVVDDVAGTTVDPVDELVEVDGEIYRFIDTAGIRRRVKKASGHEYYASLRTHRAIERAEVCVVVVDASQPG